MTQSNKLKTKPKLSSLSTSWVFDSLGTSWLVEIQQEIDDRSLEDLKKSVSIRLDDFDAIYSRFRADSLVTQISKRSGTYSFPDDSNPLFDFYRQLYDFTEGKVTPLIGNLISDAGYDADYSFEVKELRTPQSWDETISFKDKQLTVKTPVLLDFGAAGKGYAIDLVARVLKSHGYTKFLIDAGGDMVIENINSRIGLENPDNSNQLIGVATISNNAIAGSAGNRRKWAGFHHIMNPDTLKSVSDLKAVWVTADNALLADGIATALFFVKPENLHHFRFEYLMIDNMNKYKRSTGFPAEIFGE